MAFAFLLLLVGGFLIVASISDPSSDPHGAVGGAGVVAMIVAAAFVLGRIIAQNEVEVGLGRP